MNRQNRRHPSNPFLTQQHPSKKRIPDNKASKPHPVSRKRIITKRRDN